MAVDTKDSTSSNNNNKVNVNVNDDDDDDDDNIIMSLWDGRSFLHVNKWIHYGVVLIGITKIKIKKKKKKKK